MQIVKLLYRNTLRHKLRTFLTILGLTVAILAFGLLRTVISAWYAGVEASSATRLITRNAVSLVFYLLLSLQGKNPPGLRGDRGRVLGLVRGTVYSREEFFPKLRD